MLTKKFVHTQGITFTRGKHFSALSAQCFAEEGTHQRVPRQVAAPQVPIGAPQTLTGYSVRVLPRKSYIGRVEQVKPTDDEGLSPPNLLVIHEHPERGHGTEQHYIPCVPEIVQQINESKRELLIKAPKGLLQLGRAKAALHYVEPLLKDFIVRHGRGNTMPSRPELHAAGQQALVRAIEHAGGFLAVAQALGLRSKRRPPGYWDSANVLDEEISQFVAANWLQLEDRDTGGAYYYNQITHRSQFDQPIQPQRIALDDDGSFMLVEDELDRVMPSRSSVMGAGRYDLHHAIQCHGGYTQVGEMLERPSAWPHFQNLRDWGALKSALEEFNREQGGSKQQMPVLADLTSAGREDLVQAIRAAGGHHAVAEALSWRTQRRRRHACADVTEAAALVRGYLDGLPRGSPAQGQMPTLADLAACGRHDVRYALQVHGNEAIAKLLGLPPRRRGRPALKRR